MKAGVKGLSFQQGVCKEAHRFDLYCRDRRAAAMGRQAGSESEVGQGCAPARRPAHAHIRTIKLNRNSTREGNRLSVFMVGRTVAPGPPSAAVGPLAAVTAEPRQRRQRQAAHAVRRPHLVRDRQTAKAYLGPTGTDRVAYLLQQAIGDTPLLHDRTAG